MIKKQTQKYHRFPGAITADILGQAGACRLTLPRATTHKAVVPLPGTVGAKIDQCTRRDGCSTVRRNTETKHRERQDARVLTGQRKHKRPRSMPAIRVVPLLTPVHVHAEPGRGNRRASKLLLAELCECLQQLRESLGTEVVFGRRPHLREMSAGGTTQCAEKYRKPGADDGPSSHKVTKKRAERNQYDMQACCHRRRKRRKEQCVVHTLRYERGVLRRGCRSSSSTPHYW